MQLPCDPQPFLHRTAPGLGLQGVLRLLRAAMRLGQVRVAVVQHPADRDHRDDPAEHQEQRGVREVVLAAALFGDADGGRETGADDHGDHQVPARRRAVQGHGEGHEQRSVRHHERVVHRRRQQGQQQHRDGVLPADEQRGARGEDRHQAQRVRTVHRRHVHDRERHHEYADGRRAHRPHGRTARHPPGYSRKTPHDRQHRGSPRRGPARERRIRHERGIRDSAAGHAAASHTGRGRVEPARERDEAVRLRPAGQAIPGPAGRGTRLRRPVRSARSRTQAPPPAPGPGGSASTGCDRCGS